MTKEEIKKKAEESFKWYNVGQHDLAEDVYTDGYEAGAEWMQGEMEKEACEFAEWLVKRGISPIGDGKWEDSFDMPDGLLAVRTTESLYQIYKQQKP